VLVVEDEAMVRMAAVEMIQTMGFEVRQASDATQALKALGGEDRIDILFTDIGLPGMRGPELAEAALKLRPALKVIFASGYADAGDASAIAGAVHLGKPYQLEELAEVLGAAATP